MKVKRYIDTIESQNEFIGAIPSHWKVLRGAAFLYEKKKKNTGSLSDKYLSLMANRGVILYDEKGDVGNKKPEDLSKCKVVEKKDFVINSMNYAIGSYGVSPYDGICSPVYVVMCNDVEKSDHSFVNYVLSNKHYQTYAQSFGTGILDHRRAIGWDEIKRIPVPLPTKEEQKKIATYLDRETTRIDTLIEKKTRFIALLKEKRAAVISHAVTKGLDPDVPMKDSRNPLIGWMPQHWVVAPVKLMFDNLDGKRIPLSAEERGSRSGDIPYYGASGVIDYVDQHLFDEDLILVSEDGANLVSRTYRISFIARGKYWVNNHAHVLRPKDGCLDFWSERLEAIDLVPFISGATQPKLTIERLMNIRVSMPPLSEERQEIANWIKAETPRIDGLITKTERSIDLLREKRSALITAAVTGKIDVRNAA